jgi:hypothetical protein
MSDEQIRWLFIEGLTPLFGAGLIYVVWGMGKWLVCVDKSTFQYGWGAAIDSMGWLYVTLVVAIQSALRCFRATPPAPLVGGWCIVVGILSLIILLCAMDQRGQNEKWYPPSSMKWFAILLAGAVLCLGCYVHGLSS